MTALVHCCLCADLELDGFALNEATVAVKFDGPMDENREREERRWRDMREKK